ncbi:hypothetical protein R3P38DRAFT_2806115 [Favolaschia claudopus]|uniref:Uncharacterized protein n=1 Tax=Favolaschia claudopus TaxID=2862362 RepID=A0AAV9ZKM1_9AGAR
MTCTQSQALQGPDILARFRDVDFRLLESRGISRKTSYGNGECRAAFREKVSESTGIHSVVEIVGRNPQRINATRCKLDLKSPESMASHGIHSVVCQPSANRKIKRTLSNNLSTDSKSTVQHYINAAKKYCGNQRCPKWDTNHGSLTTNGPTGLQGWTMAEVLKYWDALNIFGDLVGLQNHGLEVSGVLARFRDID